jgi:chromosome segregation ATPase
MKKEFDDLKKAQDAARSEEKQADKLQEELEKKEEEFNRNANEVIDNFNKIQSQINKFTTQMEVRQAELDEELALKEAFVPEHEEDVYNDARELLLRDYVDVYQEAIDSLNTQMESAQGEFEIITEEKRLREEQAEAVAAQKAKEAEYTDMRAAVDFAKEEKEHF